ncbi:ATP-binding cassette domain-containing protein [Elioraea sp.]|uniref:ATP-binding cassette domain-containing protein n=1 Tax=Elioraea sp. TaxID=2185103 RepID=UPI003F714981
MVDARARLPVGATVELGADRYRVVGLKGPSGTGKSTLLNVVACVLGLTDGRLVRNGETVWDVRWRVTDLLRQVALDQQAAILVVTHDEKIFDRFDRMVALRDGRIEQDWRRAA